MRDDGRDPRDEEIEREIRARRGFSTADALGRRDVKPSKR